MNNTRRYFSTRNLFRQQLRRWHALDLQPDVREQWRTLHRLHRLARRSGQAIRPPWSHLRTWWHRDWWLFLDNPGDDPLRDPLPMRQWFFRSQHHLVVAGTSVERFRSHLHNRARVEILP